MATFTDNGYPNLVNVLRRMNPDGSLATRIAERISSKCQLIFDIPWKEGNRIDGHRIHALTSIPAPARRGFNQGVEKSKVLTAPYEERTCLFEEHWAIDSRLAIASGDVNRYRAQDIDKMAMGFRHTIESAFFYDNALTSPETFHGFTPRYNATTGVTTSPYVLKKGTHAGNNSRSIWLISWDENNCYGIYPKGGMPGFHHRDLGEELVFESGSTTKQYLALRSQLTWESGLCIEDHRFIVRGTYDPDDTAGGFGPTGKSLYLLMMEMLDTCFDRQNPNMRFYMDRVSKTLLRQQLMSNDVNPFSQVVLPGSDMRVEAFDGVPVGLTDRLVAETPPA